MKQAVLVSQFLLNVVISTNKMVNVLPVDNKIISSLMVYASKHLP
jgi:hypothetical protein